MLGVAGAAAALVAAPLAVAAPANAADTTSASCSVATGGSAAHTSQVCWIDFSAADFTAAGAGSGLTSHGTPGGQHYSVNIGHGYTMEFDLQYQDGNGAASVNTLGGSDSAAWLGGSANPSPGYTGTTGAAELLTNNDTTGDQLEVNNIKVYDGVGPAAAPYQIIMADAEETGVESSVPEQIVFSSDKLLTQIENAAVGQTCGGTGSGYTAGNLEYVCEGSEATKSKAAVFSSTNAGWVRTDRQTVGGTVGTAFGVIPPTKRPPTGSMTAATTAHPAAGVHAGSVVTFSTKVKNTRSNQLSTLSEIRAKFTGTGGTPVFTCAATTLAGGASTTCTATYTLTAADVRAGALSLTTRTTSRDGNGNTITATNTGGVNGGVTFGIGTSKMKQKTTAKPKKAHLHARSRVKFSTRVKNTGSQPLSRIKVKLVRFKGSGHKPHFTCGRTTLTHGATTVCRATYRLTRKDIAKGHIRITPKVTGIDANGKRVTAARASGGVRTIR